jgi:hypothetical protein
VPENKIASAVPEPNSDFKNEDSIPRKQKRKRNENHSSHAVDSADFGGPNPASASSDTSATPLKKSKLSFNDDDDDLVQDESAVAENEDFQDATASQEYQLPQQLGLGAFASSKMSLSFSGGQDPASASASADAIPENPHASESPKEAESSSDGMGVIQSPEQPTADPPALSAVAGAQTGSNAESESDDDMQMDEVSEEDVAVESAEEPRSDYENADADIFPSVRTVPAVAGLTGVLVTSYHFFSCLM